MPHTHTHTRTHARTHARTHTFSGISRKTKVFISRLNDHLPSAYFERGNNNIAKSVSSLTIDSSKCQVAKILPSVYVGFFRWFSMGPYKRTQLAAISAFCGASQYESVAIHEFIFEFFMYCDALVLRRSAIRTCIAKLSYCGTPYAAVRRPQPAAPIAAKVQILAQLECFYTILFSIPLPTRCVYASLQNSFQTINSIFWTRHRTLFM